MRNCFRSAWFRETEPQLQKCVEAMGEQQDDNHLSWSRALKAAIFTKLKGNCKIQVASLGCKVMRVKFSVNSSGLFQFV